YSVVFFTDRARTNVFLPSLHDALPILRAACPPVIGQRIRVIFGVGHWQQAASGTQGLRPSLIIFQALSSLLKKGSDPFGHVRNADRKSTHLNSSHQIISYDVFCLKKKK